MKGTNFTIEVLKFGGVYACELLPSTVCAVIKASCKLFLQNFEQIDIQLNDIYLTSQLLCALHGHRLFTV